MARFNFDPKHPSTVRAVLQQIMSDWGGDIVGSFVVADDAGPSVIAAFVFQHHAETFVRASGEDCYVCNGDGTPVDDDEAA